MLLFCWIQKWMVQNGWEICPVQNRRLCSLSKKSVFFSDFINRSFLRALLKNFSMTFLFPVFLTVLFFEHSRTAYDVIANSTVVVTSAAPLRQQGNQLNRRQQGSNLTACFRMYCTLSIFQKSCILECRDCDCKQGKF